MAIGTAAECPGGAAARTTTGTIPGIAIGTAAGMSRRSSGTDSGRTTAGTMPRISNRQKYPRPTNGGRRKEIADEETKCRKVRGGAFGENLGQYRVPQPHARNESKGKSTFCGMLHIWKSIKGFQTMTQRITDA